MEILQNMVKGRVIHVSKSSGALKTIHKEKWYLDLLFVCIFAFLSFIFLINSPLHPWIKSTAGTDSSVFKTVALMMRKGYVPYRYSFDHKGPIIYIINYLGDLISSYGGVWVFEFIFLFSTMVICYYSVQRLFKISEVFSAVAVFSGLALLFTYFEGGNLTEEYAMPFIAIGIYVFLNYLLHDNYNPFQLCACGFSFGIVLMLRINMVIMWCVFCLDILIITLLSKKRKELFVYIGWFLIGLCVAVIPIVCWLGLNGALKDFWFDYVQFNMIYSSSEGGRATAIAKWDSFYHFFNTTVFTIALLSSIFLTIKIRSRRSLWFVYTLMMIANLIFICMSGMQYNHYGMILIPVVIFPIAGMLSFLSEHTTNKQPIGAYLLAGFLLCTVIWNDWSAGINTARKKYESRNENHVSGNIIKMVELIQANTLPDDSISVYGNYDIVYVVSERTHATKYSYQFPIGTVYPAIMEEYWNELHEEQPRIIVVQRGHYDNSAKSFFENEHYDLLWAANNDSINDGNAIFIKSDGV